MRIKFTLVLTLLVVALLPSAVPAITTDSNHGLPPAPVFIELNETGIVDGSHIFENNTGIEIEYRADRYDVDGLILLGSGSNLTEDLSNTEYLRNFTRVSSLRANSFYSIELNITSYTYFYAYAWSGSISNGTMEKIDFIADSPGHELWIEEGKLYPTFNADNSGGQDRDGDLYVPLNTNLTVEYQVRNHENITDDTDFVTLSVAENDTAVFNESSALVWTNMTRVNYTTIGDFDYSIFQATINVTLPFLYFTTFNDNGWERSSATEPEVHRIITGFNFSTSFSEELNAYTNLDPIVFNITTYNITDSFSSVGYQYRVYENSSSDNPLVNWTITENLTNITSELLNSSEGGSLQVNSTLRQVYNASIGTFNESNLVEVQTFFRYGEGTNITSDVFRIEIISSDPTLSITSRNETITRASSKIVQFTYDTPKGEIETAVITHSLPNGDQLRTTDIEGDTNATIDFSYDGNDTIRQGNHTLMFNITNSLGVSTTQTFVYIVDQEAPTGTIAITFPTTEVTETGEVTVSITFEDIGVDPTGVKYVTLNWGNNMTIDATDLSEASMKYRRSGSFTITLNVYDKAGNQFTVQTSIIVDLPVTAQESVNNDGPLPIAPVILSLSAIVLVISKRRRS